MKRNLVIGLLSYFVVLALLLGVISQWHWSVFFTPIKPSLIIVVVMGAVLVVLVHLFLTARLRERPLMSVSTVLVVVGVSLIFLHWMYPEVSNLAGYDVVNFGASAIGIGIAFLSLDIASQSDNRMKAMANLEFHEKIAVLENYLVSVRLGRRVVVKSLGHDVDGAMQLRKFVEPDLEADLKQKLKELVAEAFQYLPLYADLIAEIFRLQEKYYGDSGTGMDREEEIRLIAYRIWQEEGCCHGRDLDHWFRANMIWQEHHNQASAAAETEPALRRIAKRGNKRKTGPTKPQSID